jgi:hypothetical protein
MGFCAEHAVVAEMLKAREAEIAVVVAIGAHGAILTLCGCFVALAGRRGGILARTSPVSPAPLAVPVFVTNESALTRRLELRVDDVVVLDTVVGRPLDVTARVLLDTVRLAPGKHRLVLMDHHRNQQFTTQLDARTGAMCIFISLMGPSHGFSRGQLHLHVRLAP